MQCCAIRPRPRERICDRARIGSSCELCKGVDADHDAFPGARDDMEVRRRMIHEVHLNPAAAEALYRRHDVS